MADQCNVSVELVQRIHNVWIALASGLPIDADKFDEYCKVTYDIYERDLWNEKTGKVWYPMSPSLHKVLKHGGEVIRLLPPSILIGMLSEEPTERQVHRMC